jgi:hypothetical protein
MDIMTKSLRSTAVLVVGVVLVLVHSFLGLWGMVGLAEWLLPSVPWPRVSNPELPRGILLAQWVLLLTAAGVFIAGYFTRWRLTPWAMAAVYTAMASLCALQTFTYLTNESRFRAMAIEYVEYAVILVILFSTRFLGRSSPASSTAG